MGLRAGIDNDRKAGGVGWGGGGQVLEREDKEARVCTCSMQNLTISAREASQ
jgi:hypothetical protein